MKKKNNPKQGQYYPVYGVQSFLNNVDGSEVFLRASRKPDINLAKDYTLVIIRKSVSVTFLFLIFKTLYKSALVGWGYKIASEVLALKTQGSDTESQNTW